MEETGKLIKMIGIFHVKNAEKTENRPIRRDGAVLEADQAFFWYSRKSLWQSTREVLW